MKSRKFQKKKEVEVKEIPKKKEFEAKEIAKKRESAPTIGNKENNLEEASKIRTKTVTAEPVKTKNKLNVMEDTDKLAESIAGMQTKTAELKQAQMEIAELNAMVEDANRETTFTKEQLAEAKKMVNMTSASKDHAEMERD